MFRKLTRRGFLSCGVTSTTPHSAHPFLSLTRFNSGHANRFVPFRLSHAFLKQYENRPVKWGFNGLGEFVYKRTYARIDLDTGRQEEWRDTCKRVIEGVFRIQQRHLCGDVMAVDLAQAAANRASNRGAPIFDPESAQKLAQEMYARMYEFKWMPAGRGLWAMGTGLTEGVRNPCDPTRFEKAPLYAALNNCGFVSTGSLLTSRATPLNAEPGQHVDEKEQAEHATEHCDDSGGEELAADADFDQIKQHFGFEKRPPSFAFDAEKVSTAGLSPSDPFHFLMEASMLGIGCGFDTKGASYVVKGVDRALDAEVYVIPDSREGWCEALAKIFDYSRVRPRGEPIRTFGGIASGPGPLKKLLDDVDAVFESRRGQALGMRGIVDIMNMIGVCVVSGNVRRTAEIAFGDWRDEEYLDLKNYAKNPERAPFSWASNNSVIIEDESDLASMDYSEIAKRIVDNGEPGIAWLCNMRKYGRMRDEADFADRDALGGNPCLEQTLCDRELCNLVETFPNNHSTLDDFKETMRYALLYGKIVSLADVHFEHTRAIMRKNRRIGISMTGLQQLYARFEGQGEQRLRRVLAAAQIEDYEGGSSGDDDSSGEETDGKTAAAAAAATTDMAMLKLKRETRLKNEMTYLNELTDEQRRRVRVLAVEELKKWCNEAYEFVRVLDTHYSALHGVPRSVKLTSVKPSGSVSLLTGATPGLHWPFGDYYLRRVRVSRTAHRPLIERLQAKGLTVENAVEDTTGDTVVVEFPCKTEGCGTGIKKESEVSLREQLEFAALMQAYWSDNQVSCTATFDRQSEGAQVAELLKEFQYKLKGVSFLPRSDASGAAYAQMPYEAISKESYEAIMERIDHSITLDGVTGLSPECIPAPKFCSNDKCEV